jgi:sigma-B regulation protein RsbU (phosphoserine phosphatase)
MAAYTSDEILQLNNELRGAREELERCGKLLLAIQRSILPQQLPSVPGLDLAVYFADADGAGGDYYDVRPVGPDHWAIVIADVCGHGLGAAAILALVHALGNAVQGQQVPPGAALALINKPLATRYLANTAQFVTAFVGLYDAEGQVLTYASAGHPPPRLVRGNEVRQLDAVSGLPLGINKESVYENETLQLMSGDRLILFTDGITESTDAADVLFGEERLDAVLRAPASTAAELMDHVVHSVRTFRGGRPAGDDETCLVAAVKPVQQSTQVRRK